MFGEARIVGRRFRCECGCIVNARYLPSCVGCSRDGLATEIEPATGRPCEDEREGRRVPATAPRQEGHDPI